MRRMVLHSEFPGIWIAHILDMAWQAQSSNDYSEEAKLQLLVWAYGYPTHVVGDRWSHTLVNEFSNGTWPDVANVITYDIAQANVVRHLMVEGYLADACPGFDGIKKIDDDVHRRNLPTGDVSDDSTPERELAAPIDFIYDAMPAN